ncbi:MULTISPECIES: alanine racemase [unclassified Mesorhizobium]|uniref:alanine racemase n=1 Tax=unclassified Mesorhizobium TaxID=325217 RepID=UPI000FD53BCF|nr:MULTISPECIES: alanine racemase [unclassified Mesorhizobium]RVB80590.1 alanine racemase [Mesorhizobium sp. M6A.T.Cr.TU.014.01.1.1]RWQ06446.1 MAG: alanine racemase [Mesorhizobium sp.]RWQ10824.1 MAG: alanine racemase [Mesorhizobium sp.]
MLIDQREPPHRPTPFAYLDMRRLRRNLARMQAIADRHGVALRPHIKTHKSVEIARLQLALGAIGVTASKPSEALPFIQAGAPSLLLAFPIIDAERLRGLSALAAEHETATTFILDSEAGADALADAARQAGRIFDVHIKIDVGLGRVGVLPMSSALTTLGEVVARNPKLRLTGLISHAGHGYGATSRSMLAQISRQERLLMLETRQRLAPLGLPLRITVGSTPTVLATDDFSGIDEIRPGNYALFDLTAERLGLATEDEIALGVVTTVVSRTSQHYIVDAGSKALTSDLGPHSSGGLAGYGRILLADSQDAGTRLTVRCLSEEHGFVPREDTDLPTGTRLLVLPNHSCPVVNLYDRLVIGDKPATDLAVSARGALS